ncbi:unnamed protein product [Rhizoctonia solani]|uniref:Uncharacterized protein n=1 Tax=Rhizoctonia solani TaxID=456999 RepID=A0A8H3CAI8_9AGAM|nr:unnamed protein product [Rhizoctonia solani]
MFHVHDGTTLGNVGLQPFVNEYVFNLILPCFKSGMNCTEYPDSRPPSCLLPQGRHPDVLQLLDTLRGPAPKQPREATVEEEGEGEEEWAARAVTPAVALATCLVIAFRGPSATTAVELGTFPGIARNLNGGHATLVAPKGTSRVIAPTRAPRLKLMERGEMFFSFQRLTLLSLPFSTAYSSLACSLHAFPFNVPADPPIHLY